MHNREGKRQGDRDIEHSRAEEDREDMGGKIGQGREGRGCE
jgi:hypothetical protein